MTPPSSQAEAPSRNAGSTAVGVLYAAIVLGLGLRIASAPLPTLLDRFIPDDAFYYLQTAKTFATTGFSSFDRIHFTNGYQPLWFLLNVPVFLLMPAGGALPLRVLLVFEVILAAAGAAVMARAVARVYGPIASGLAGLLWVAVFHQATANGLETGLQAFLFALLLSRFLVDLAAVTAEDHRRHALAMGVIGGLLFLARTDAVFLIAALAARFFLEPRTGPGRSRGMSFAAPVVLIAGPYLILNLVTTGHLMPVSGSAKMYHSDLVRDAAIHARGSAAAVYARNLVWPFRDPSWWPLVSLFAPVVLFFVETKRKAASSIRVARETWPFTVGVWATVLFYGVAFFEPFSRTLWYYGPLLMVGWLSVAGLATAVSRVPLLGAVSWCAPYLVVTQALGWLTVPLAAMAAVGVPIAAWVGTRLSARVQSALAIGAVVATTLVMVRFVFSGSFLVADWQVVTAVAIVASGLLATPRLSRLALAQMTIGVVLPSVAIVWINLVASVQTPAANWNYHLHQGARWAEANLPQDATIWSNSAGGLGYFSNRRVVNTDGLANDYEFLNSVLKGGTLGAYVERWDYAIDAFGDDSLQQYYPEGCFVPLPPGTVPAAFSDGVNQRRLRVFQMKAAGVVNCANVKAIAARALHLVNGLVIDDVQLGVNGLGLALTAERPIARNYKVFVHTFNSVRAEGVPAHLYDFYLRVPTSQMKPGMRYEDGVTFPIPLDPGASAVEFGLFDEADPQFPRLAGADGATSIVVRP